MRRERLLERAQLLALGEPLDGGDLRAVRLHREQHAALHRLAVEVDRAGAAVAGVAADVRAGQVDVVADEVDEQAARVDLALVDDAVHLDRDRAALRGVVHAQRPLCSLGCLLDRAHRADGGQMAAIVGRRVHVRRRLEPRVRDGFADARLVRGGRSDQDRHGVDAAERDPRLAAGEARSGVRDAGAVAADRDRGEAVGGLRGGGDGDGEEQLALADDGQVDAEEELLRRHGSLAVRAANRHRGAERDEQRRQVVGRVVRADVAADRAPVAHLDVRDLRGHLGEDRPRDLDLGRRHDLRVRRHRAQLERVARDRDRPQVFEPAQVDEDVRRGRARLHHADERLAAGEGARAFVRRQEPNGLVHRRRPHIFDLTQEHRENLTQIPS